MTDPLAGSMINQGDILGVVSKTGQKANVLVVSNVTRRRGETVIEIYGFGYPGDIPSARSADAWLPLPALSAPDADYCAIVSGYDNSFQDFEFIDNIVLRDWEQVWPSPVFRNSEGQLLVYDFSPSRMDSVHERFVVLGDGTKHVHEWKLRILDAPTFAWDVDSLPTTKSDSLIGSDQDFLF